MKYWTMRRILNQIPGSAFCEEREADAVREVERRIEEVLRKKLGGIINGTLLLCPSRTDRVECGK